MKYMPGPKLHGLYGRVALRAMQDALYEHEIDLCWKELKDIFGRPEVMEAEELILRAIAEHFAGEASALRKGRRRAAKAERVEPRTVLGFRSGRRRRTGR